MVEPSELVMEMKHYLVLGDNLHGVCTRLREGFDLQDSLVFLDLTEQLSYAPAWIVATLDFAEELEAARSAIPSVQKSILEVIKPETPPYKRKYRITVTGAQLDALFAGIAVLRTFYPVIKDSWQFKGLREIATNLNRHSFPTKEELDELDDKLQNCEELSGDSNE